MPNQQQSKEKASFVDRALSVLAANWFIAGVGIVIAAAKLHPALGRKGGPLLPELTVSYLGVMVIFFCSGISLPTNQLKAALFHYRLHALTQGFSFVGVPIITSILLKLLRPLAQSAFPGPRPDAESPLVALLEGLQLVSCMPPPVSTALILTKQIGGNEAGAVFNAAFGSFLGIFVTPTLLLVVFGEKPSVPLADVVAKLSGTVLLPLLVLNVFLFVLICSVGVLLMIIYTAFCDTFLRNIQIGLGPLLTTVVLVVVAQLLFMRVVFTIASFPEFGFTREDIVCIVFTATHKSLTLGMPLISLMFGADPRFTYLAIPLLIYHPGQIVVGSLLVPTFVRYLKGGPAAVRMDPLSH